MKPIMGIFAKEADSEPGRSFDSDQSSEVAADFHGNADSGEHARTWKSSFFRFGPLSGIFTMLLAIASIIASLGILAGSDNQPLHDWNTPPSTYLAIFTAVANLSMRYSVFQGVVIAWWLRALKGSCLSKLHWDWRAGSSIRGALMAGRHMGILGLAYIFSTLVARASTVVIGPGSNKPLTLNVTMAPEIPRGYTGIWATASDMGYPNGYWSPSWNETIPVPNGTAPNNIFTADEPIVLTEKITKANFQSSPLEGVVKGCPGQCKTTIKAPAMFPTACSEHTVPVTFTELWDYSRAYDELMAPPLNTFVFMISTTLVLDGKEKIALTTGYADDPSGVGGLPDLQDCKSTFTYKTCILEAGIGEYDAVVEGDKLIMTSLSPPTLVALSNNTAVDHQTDNVLGYHRSTLGGVVSWVWSEWETFVAYYKPKNTDAQAITIVNSAINVFEKIGHMCPSFNDPRDAVMASLNRLMVYTGAHAAHIPSKYLDGGVDAGQEVDPHTPVHTTVTGYQIAEVPVYHTDYFWFLAAAIVELVCILLVAPTYWGWWNIGRPVSFSPLEMAKAFESPLLSQCNSNSSGQDLARQLKDTRVQYGEIANADGTKKLAFGVQSVSMPQERREFDIPRQLDQV